ncbi:MAG: hypothetical protein N2746_10370 [Deltaproteobacteria bacterium]|nr:hypothetical protein [Deltaproteobacteria bacterium]
MDSKYLIFFIFLLTYLESPNLYSECNRGRKAENGDWVTYSIYSGKEKMELKLAIVGEEKEGDEKAIWFELLVRTRELDYIIKRLIVGDPIKPDRVIRQIVKVVNKNRPEYSPAIEVPVDHSDKVDDTLKSFPCFDEIGEKIQYKLGKKKIDAYIAKGEGETKPTIIFSEEIPFFGIVKIESKQSKIDLLNMGRNASTEITEEPIRLMIQDDNKIK